jgi:AcrR family transcriptional regulator
VGSLILDESTPEGRVMAAAMRCCERWGVDKVTIDDIAAEAKVSRATLYRLFPGGRDVLFDRIRELETLDFFTRLDAHVSAADSLEDLVVAVFVEATRELRADEHLTMMLASSPGEVLTHMGFSDLPRIIELATAFLRPRVQRYLGAREAAELAEVMTRTVLSLFFTPSAHVDLAVDADARQYVQRFIVPAFSFSTITR